MASVEEHGEEPLLLQGPEIRVEGVEDLVRGPELHAGLERGEVEATSELQGAGEASGGSGRETGVAEFLVGVIREFGEGPVRDEAGLGAAGDGDQEVGGGEQIGWDQDA